MLKINLLNPRIPPPLPSPLEGEGGVGGLPRTPSLRSGQALWALAMAVLLFNAYISRLDALVIDKIVAIVNNEIITMSEVDEDILHDRFRLDGRYTGSDLNLKTEGLFRERLKMVIDKRLQLQMANKTGISVSQEEIKMTIEDIKRKNSIKSDKEFIRALEEERLTQEGFTEEIREQLILVKLINKEVRSKIVVRDEELHDYYDKNRSHFALPQEIRISQILIPIAKGISETAIEDLRRGASRLVEEIRSGNDFFSSARRYKGVIDGISAADLGFFKKGELIPSLEEAAGSMKVGEVSGPFETQIGIHIIRLDEKGSLRYKPFEEVAKDIEDAVYQEKYNEALAKWLKEIRDGSYVEVRF